MNPAPKRPAATPSFGEYLRIVGDVVHSGSVRTSASDDNSPRSDNDRRWSNDDRSWGDKDRTCDAARLVHAEDAVDDRARFRRRQGNEASN